LGINGNQLKISADRWRFNEHRKLEAPGGNFVVLKEKAR
jgi:hypothetical protein